MLQLIGKVMMYAEVRQGIGVMTVTYWHTVHCITICNFIVDLE